MGKVNGISLGCKDALIQLMGELSAHDSDDHLCVHHKNNAACKRLDARVKVVDIVKDDVFKWCVKRGK